MGSEQHYSSETLISNTMRAHILLVLMVVCFLIFMSSVTAVSLSAGCRFGCCLKRQCDFAVILGGTPFYHEADRMSTLQDHNLYFCTAQVLNVIKYLVP